MIQRMKGQIACCGGVVCLSEQTTADLGGDNGAQTNSTLAKIDGVLAEAGTQPEFEIVTGSARVA